MKIPLFYKRMTTILVLSIVILLFNGDFHLLLYMSIYLQKSHPLNINIIYLQNNLKRNIIFSIINNTMCTSENIQICFLNILYLI